MNRTIRSAMGWSTVLLLMLGASSSWAAPPATSRLLLREKGKFGPQPENKAIVSRMISVAETGVEVGINVTVVLTKGTAAYRVVAEDGRVLFEKSAAKKIKDDGRILKAVDKPQTLRLEITGEGAVGTWNVIALTSPERHVRFTALLGGLLMILVGLTFVIWWRRRSGEKLRWFWAGAGIWTVGVALKFAWALAANARIMSALEAALPRPGYIAVGGCYIGILTGVFEIGATLACALMWRRLATSGNRAVAVGVGAGAFEAIMVGMVTVVAMSVLAAVPGKADSAFIAITYANSITPWAWLAGPLERVMAILPHTASRALVLLGVTTRRWRWFGLGFVLLSLIDASVGLFYAAGIVGDFSNWWLELMIVPFALVSIPVIRWCLRVWPRPASTEIAAPEVAPTISA